jgi:hypothetical protein
MRRFASVADLPSKSMLEPGVIEVERHFASVATIQPGHWTFASKAGVWMRLKRPQEVQFVGPVMKQQGWFSEPKLQPRVAPPLIRLASALLLPILSLPLTHSEYFRFHFLDESLTPLLFELFSLTILATV